MENTEYISIGELKKLLTFNDIRTINNYVKQGKLPKPVSDGGEICFNKGEVAEKLGVDDLDEPFIDINAAEKILDLVTAIITHWCKEGLLPHYRLSPMKGSKLLFRESELREAQKIIFVKSSGFHDLKKKLSYYKDILSSLLDQEVITLSEKEKDIVISILIQDQTLEKTGERFSLSRERIGQIFQRACWRLRLRLRNLKRESEQNKILYGDIRALVQKVKILEAENKAIREKLDMGTKEQTDYEKVDFQLLATHLFDLDLSVRALNCLQAAEIKTLGNLVEYEINELIKFRNFGKKTLHELEELVESKGLEFGMKLP